MYKTERKRLFGDGYRRACLVKSILKNTMRGCGANYPVDHTSCQSARCDSFLSTVEFHLSGLIETASHPDMQKIRIIGFFFENRLNWHFEKVWLLLFAVCTCA
jgi:hypothetical protein